MASATPAQPRAIFLINHYMNGIHAGIQAGHAVSRFHRDHPPGHPATALIRLWDVDPWMYLFNGGFDSHLEEAMDALRAINRELADAPHPDLPATGVPFACFHEGKSELRGSCTAVMVLLPGSFSLRNDEGDLPPEFAALLKKSRRHRAQTAVV